MDLYLQLLGALLEQQQGLLAPALHVLAHDEPLVRLRVTGKCQHSRSAKKPAYMLFGFLKTPKLQNDRILNPLRSETPKLNLNRFKDN
jgi:hypothetical protein